MWKGYKETYSRLEPMRQELALYMQKKNAGNKRKLAEMQQEAEQLMVDAERYAYVLCYICMITSHSDVCSAIDAVGLICHHTHTFSLIHVNHDVSKHHS